MQRELEHTTVDITKAMIRKERLYIFRIYMSHPEHV